MLTHVLDTSAWLTHVFGEPGHEIVADLITDPAASLGISAVSLLELHARMKAVGALRLYSEVLNGYKEIFDLIIPADETIAIRATDIREVASARVPAMDSLIAATAAANNAILVHRDPHFQTIPETQLQQLVLTGSK
ncbi:MAG: PIN domain-containing protein [Chloroflexota bacterium]